MTRRSWLAGAAAGVTVALVGGCGVFHSASFRFRVTVEIDTPQGLRTGSSVMELVAERNLLRVGDSGPTLASLKGQAVVVDLPSGPVFMLLDEPMVSDGFLGNTTRTFAPDSGPSEKRLDVIRELGRESSVGRSVILPPSLYTLFVRFRDIGRSETVQILDNNDFARDLGSGYSLRRVTMTLTKENVTSGIEKRLPWLRSLKANNLGKPWKFRDTPTREQRLDYGSLWTGFN